MSSSRVFKIGFMGVIYRRTNASSSIRFNPKKDTLVQERSCFGCRFIYSQAGQQDSNVDRPSNIGPPISKLGLLNKIKSSQKKFKIVSLPNFITTSRAMMAPAMGYFIVNNMHSYALVCCTYAVLSDILDKTVAYYTNQTSPLNTTLDALADKLLIVTGCISLYKMDIMSIFMLKSVVIRDFMILAGGAAVRYNGFEQKPTLKQYLDINNYPTLCFQVVLLNRIVTGLQYSVIMAHLALNHLTGDPTYDWAIYLWQGLALSMSSISVAWYLSTFFQPKFITKYPKRYPSM